MSYPGSNAVLISLESARRRVKFSTPDASFNGFLRGRRSSGSRERPP